MHEFWYAHLKTPPQTATFIHLTHARPHVIVTIVMMSAVPSFHVPPSPPALQIDTEVADDGDGHESDGLSVTQFIGDTAQNNNNTGHLNMDNDVRATTSPHHNDDVDDDESQFSGNNSNDSTRNEDLQKMSLAADSDHQASVKEARATVTCLTLISGYF